MSFRFGSDQSVNDDNNGACLVPEDRAGTGTFGMYYIRRPVLVIRLTQIYFMRYFLRGIDLSFVLRCSGFEVTRSAVVYPAKDSATTQVPGCRPAGFFGLRLT